MDYSLSRSAKSAETMGKKKFIRLSVNKQHTLLASLAKVTLDKDSDFEAFQRRYDELQSWSDLDRYTPPPWLNKKESLFEFYDFHYQFTLTSAKPDLQEIKGDRSITWNPQFNVEIVCDQVRSPYNVGSIVRIIDNFGFQRLVHSSSGLRTDHPKLIKAARGSQKWIPIKYMDHLPAYLMESKIPVIGIEDDVGAVLIDHWDPPDHCALVVGNEEYGIAEAIRSCCNCTVRIPMHGYKKSMNVHHALSIAGYKIIEKHKPAG